MNASFCLLDRKLPMLLFSVHMVMSAEGKSVAVF